MLLGGHERVSGRGSRRMEHSKSRLLLQHGEDRWLCVGLAPGNRAEHNSVGLCRVLGLGQLSLRQAGGSTGLEVLEGRARKQLLLRERGAPFLTSPAGSCELMM